jgi:hypothetical protein
MPVLRYQGAGLSPPKERAWPTDYLLLLAGDLVIYEFGARLDHEKKWDSAPLQSLLGDARGRPSAFDQWPELTHPCLVPGADCIWLGSFVNRQLPFPGNPATDRSSAEAVILHAHLVRQFSVTNRTLVPDTS